MVRPKSNNQSIELIPLQKSSLRDTAAEVIKRYIFATHLGPGKGLPTERELSDGLAVSRTVVREALTVLEIEGLIERRPSVGYFTTDRVQELHLNGTQALDQLLEQTFEFRVSIELGAQHITIRKATDSTLADLAQKAREIDQAMDNQAAHAEAEVNFHVNMLIASGNEALVAAGRQALGEYFRVLALVRPDSFIKPPDAGASRHLPIVKALAARDLDLAQSLLWQHCQFPDWQANA
ncbi:FadR/GntR family transcriptional regulator [soil metagenome]